MKLMLCSSPVTAVRSNGSFTALPMQNVLAPRTVEVATVAECETARKAYIDAVKATGRAAAVTAHQPHICRGRKVRGFDAWSRGQVLVNADLVKEA